jgi:PAS domain S-box-containing protein
MKHELKLLIIIVCVFLTGYLIEKVIDEAGVPHSVEETIEIFSEFFSVFVAFSIFAITWHAYNKSRDNHSLFLGTAFLVVGLLSLFHALSYPFMPEFITSNSSHKAALFLLESRLVLALAFLLSVDIYKDTFPGLNNRRVLASSAIVFSLISLAFIVLYQDDLFAGYDPENGYSAEMIFLSGMITVVILYAGYLYKKRIKETGQGNLTLLIDGSIVAVFSNLVYFSYEFSGHFLIITGFFFIYLGLYKSSVEQPYEKLAIAEEKLRHAAEEKYRSLFDSAHDAIVTVDLEQRVTSWNASAEKIFGWMERDVKGKKISEFMIPEKGYEKYRSIINKVTEGGIVSGIDVICLCKDGKKANISLTVSPMLDADRKISGMSAIMRDITERKKAEEVHLENVRLTLANKAKSEFLATMSHELRTPLNSIIGFSELLKQGGHGALNEKQEHYSNNVIASGKHLLSLIDGILDISKVEAGKMDIYIEKMPVPETINETLELIKERASKHNVILEKEFDPELDFIEVDRQKFKQIFFNLLSNAVKFSKSDGGKVTVTTKKEGDRARFSVSDTGIGIKEEDRGRLFKSFEQLDSGISRSYGGTGLGLAISKKLVELHGGKIMAESKYEEGSTFTFYLPIISKKVT